MLKKEFRINQAKDYNYIYNYGKKIPGRYIIVYIIANNLGYNRFGFVTSKKIGNAVIRNRVKRQLRAVISRNLKELSGSNDIVIIGRHNIGEFPFSLIEKDLIIVLRKAGLC